MQHTCKQARSPTSREAPLTTLLSWLGAGWVRKDFCGLTVRNGEFWCHQDPADALNEDHQGRTARRAVTREVASIQAGRSTSMVPAIFIRSSWRPTMSRAQMRW